MIARKRIQKKEEAQMYRKVGSKYEPVGDLYAYEGLGEGWWLIRVQPGCTTVRECVYPDRAEAAAAFRECADQLAKWIMDASSGRPDKHKMTEDEVADWKKLVKKHGWRYIQYDSAVQIADKVIAEVVKRRGLKL